MPLIVADIGNSRVKWGRSAARAIDDVASLPPDDPAAWQNQSIRWALGDESWVVASVQPQTRERFLGWLLDRGRPVRIIETHLDIPIALAVDYPEQVGLDRLLNAVAANSRRAPNQSAIIVDAGSAVTVDLVDRNGVFRGGAILPGLRLMAKSLHDYTAKLPLVEINERRPPPGTSTITAIETGVFHAVAGGIDRLVAEMPHEDAVVYFAGGDAALLAPHLRTASRVWPEMTLEGLRETAAASPSRAR
jgi:type III pantothenate kinase